MNLLLFIVSGILGLFIGIYFGKKMKKYDGLFIVDDSNDQKIQWILDVTIDPESIPTKEEIRLKIKKLDKSSCE